MQLDGRTIRLSATDLSRQIACRHLIQLERGAAEGRLRRPQHVGEQLDLLRERGLAHERDYIEILRAEGRDVVELREVEGTSAVERTLAAMRRGAGAIVQGALSRDRWQGRTDVLLRVDRPSALGGWSYEVVDTKLAQETRGGTLLQLCLYTDLVGIEQRLVPERMHVVKPGERPVTESFRVDDFAAYYRFVRGNLEQTIDAGPRADTYPDPVPQCEVCPWWTRCDARRREDDHLSFVAGMQALHRTELVRQGIPTLQRFAERATPLPERPERGSADVFARLHDQARVQLRGRREGAPVHELLPVVSDLGLTRLPEPSRHDVYFDLESDPFVDGGGLEYLFGWAFREKDGTLAYRSVIALDHAAERRALEELVDFVSERWRQDPGMHVYHFSPYEPAAIKRLMGRHATRESDVDRLLRGRRFVDLHAVTRQAVRASVESYSLKQLEAFTAFARDVDLPEAGRAMRRVARALELELPVPPADLATVERYNRDDCLSTAALQDWLERLREEHLSCGTSVPRPAEAEGDASAAVEEREARVREVFERLVADLPEERDDWNEGQRARWLLAHCLEYFQREDKCAWWEFFRLHELDHDELLDERKAVSGLRFVGRAGGTAACPIERYEFPPQEAAVDEGDAVHEVGGQQVGNIAAVDQARRTIEIKKRAAAAGVHPCSIFVFERVPPRPLDSSLLELAASIAEHGVDGTGPFRAARDFLLKRPPRLRAGLSGPLRRPEETALDAAERLVAALDHGTLAIQGPPGAGKTHAGAQLIVALAGAGKRIGVTAVSHKVIRNLLDKALEKARERGVRLQAVHRNARPLGDPRPDLRETRDNDEALGALSAGSVVGGTAWLWARDDATERLDYLFVDEAGQLSLAHLLACARSAKNIVLLGDPQQLEQPRQGSHPEGSGVSALEHLLDGHETIPEGVGLFLDRTWRLHPAICEFTSEVYYEGRLSSRDGRERQRIDGAAPFDGSGLYYVPVPHSGNQNTSPEEVAAVERVLGALLRAGASWTDADGNRRPLVPDDVLVVGPYNAHVGAISRGLPGVRVGTVDKFQGQEAPVVVYSMASSSVEDAPRGMEFLFDPHRLNVASSRARCACILIAAPALIGPDCRSPRQMRQANGLCRFLELARVVELDEI